MTEQGQADMHETVTSAVLPQSNSESFLPPHELRGLLDLCVHQNTSHQKNESHRAFIRQNTISISRVSFILKNMNDIQGKTCRLCDADFLQKKRECKSRPASHCRLVSPCHHSGCSLQFLLRIGHTRRQCPLID